ncbi:hypothetical protein [Cryptosporangium minutisporangium]|uniref:PIN domain-containing protein n=1 Tax=Cryptosporangium minutisporangium TaxID=113569 RepID=A0ABP6SQX8_9ACTN
MIVIDASALADALMDDGDIGEQARRLLASDPGWAAPSHLVVEVLSVLRVEITEGGAGVVLSGPPTRRVGQR